MNSESYRGARIARFSAALTAVTLALLLPAVAVAGIRPPKVTKTVPKQHQKNVSCGSSLSVVFNQPIKIRSLHATLKSAEHKSKPHAIKFKPQEMGKTSAPYTLSSPRR
jgi:hypothetical protein